MDEAVKTAQTMCNYIPTCLAYDWADNGVNLKFESDEMANGVVQHLPEHWVVKSERNACTKNCQVHSTFTANSVGKCMVKGAELPSKAPGTLNGPRYPIPIT